MADARVESRRTLLRRTYPILFGLATAGLVLIGLSLVAILQRWDSIAEDPILWVTGGGGLLLGFVVSPRMLPRARWHTACRLLGGWGTLVAAGVAAYFFVVSATINNWDSLSYFVYGIAATAVGVELLLIFLCGFVGKRWNEVADQ